MTKATEEICLTKKVIELFLCSVLDVRELLDKLVCYSDNTEHRSCDRLVCLLVRKRILLYDILREVSLLEVSLSITELSGIRSICCCSP